MNKLANKAAVIIEPGISNCINSYPKKIIATLKIIANIDRIRTKYLKNTFLSKKNIIYFYRVKM